MALLLAWSLLPGGFELAEQTVHLVSKGHLAHSIPDDPDEPPVDAEHGCQGLMHVCHCYHGAGQVGPKPPGSPVPLSVRLPSTAWYRNATTIRQSGVCSIPPSAGFAPCSSAEKERLWTHATGCC